MHYVAFFPVHGLRLVAARSMADALSTFKSANRGVAPSWVSRVYAASVGDVMSLRRLGFTGTKHALHVQLINIAADRAGRVVKGRVGLVG